jgi:hypothetical protein
MILTALVFGRAEPMHHIAQWTANHDVEKQVEFFRCITSGDQACVEQLQNTSGVEPDAVWWAVRDSNTRPPACKAGALTS